MSKDILTNGIHIAGRSGQVSVVGDVVHGDKVGGDRVGGDHISVGNISGGTGVAIGRGAQATVTQTMGVTGVDLAQIFAPLVQKVSAMPDGPSKVIAQNAVQGLEAEANKGEAASEDTVSQWLTFLATTAPDAWQVAVETFKNPIQGLSLAFQKIAQKAARG